MSSKFGNPIADSVSIAGGEATYFQGGCIFKRSSLQQPIQGLFHAPLLGRPAIVSTDKPGRLPLALSFGLSQKQWNDISKNANLLRKLWQDRLILQRVEKPSESVHLGIEIDKVFEPGEIIDLANGFFKPIRIPSESKVVVLLKCRVSNEAGLQDRSLYNIGFRLPNGKTYAIAPHAIYAKRAWDSFGFIHATDLHVSRRLEGFRRKLKQANRAGAARKFNNCNDNVSDMIKYANDLHRSGMLDFVMATGDLVDYKFERGDNREGGGNFALLKELILGLTSSTDEEGAPNEELCVPIFMTLGNHDYRPNPYELYFTVDIPLWKDISFSYSSSLNLRDAESVALQGGKKLKVSRDRARGMVAVEKQNPYYWEHVCDQPSYVVELGQHRFVMLDSGYDIGVLESDWDAIKVKMGFGGEDQRIFAAGSPNSLGFRVAQLELLRRALKEAGPAGLVIVGIHAPPLNPKGNEYPHYFRETEHPTLDKERGQVEGFLRRQAPGAFVNLKDISNPPDPTSVHPTWPRTGTAHFKIGGVGELLDFGISKGEIGKFLELCVGRGAHRPVDLVLCGHTHMNVEYRLQRATDDRLRFLTDFYTENPAVYYPSYEPPALPVFIRVKDEASLNQMPAKGTDLTTGEQYRQLDVPPYDRPLNTASDAKAWWQERRPLIIQTSGLGPLESSQRATKPKPTFQGFRVISVENNTISKIQCVRLADLKDRKKCGRWLEPVLNIMMS